MAKNNENSKTAITIRFKDSAEIDEIDKLARIHYNLKTSTVARTYLSNMRYFKLEPNYDLKFYDDVPLAIVPRNRWKAYIDSLPDNNKIELGDDIGKTLNSNMKFANIATISEKMEYLKRLCWFDMKVIEYTPPSKPEEPKKPMLLWGFSAAGVHIILLLAILYRIVGQKRLDEKICPLDQLKEYHGLSDDQIMAKFGKDKKGGEARVKFMHDTYNPPIIHTLGAPVTNLYAEDPNRYYVFTNIRAELEGISGGDKSTPSASGAPANP